VIKISRVIWGEKLWQLASDLKEAVKLPVTFFQGRRHNVFCAFFLLVHSLSMSISMEELVGPPILLPTHPSYNFD